MGNELDNGVNYLVTSHAKKTGSEQDTKWEIMWVKNMAAQLYTSHLSRA